jgi:predicted dehydrogenase
MNQKRILVVGFGMMGCRHVQAFLQDKEKYEVHVLELSGKNIKENLLRINAQDNDFIWHKELKSLPLLDIAIIATSSAPRFEIIKTLLKIGYDKFLLEKIVFQSEEQFKIVVELLKKSKSVAYCNFVNRYFNIYNTIKKELLNSKEQTNITIHGGEYGLACNAIHYIDIFQYLTGNNNILLKKSKINISQSENRRGEIYKEFNGFISFKNSKSDTIKLISEPNYTVGVTINIQNGDQNYLLNENTEMVYFNTPNDFNFDKFSIIPTSKLSKVIVEDIFDDNCRLTKIEETYSAHVELFNIFNIALYGESSIDTLCPIT